MWSFARERDWMTPQFIAWPVGVDWVPIDANGRTGGGQIRRHYLTQTFHHARNLSVQTSRLVVTQKYKIAHTHKYRNTDSEKHRNTCDISSPFPTQAIFECKEVLHCCRALLLAYLFNEPLLKNWIPTFARVALIYGFKWPQRLNSLIFLLLSFAIKWIL